MVKVMCVHIKTLENKKRFVSKYKNQKKVRTKLGSHSKYVIGKTKYVSCKRMSIEKIPLKSPVINNSIAVNKSRLYGRSLNLNMSN